jgi:hypothetical protein
MNSLNFLLYLSRSQYNVWNYDDHIAWNVTWRVYDVQYEQSTYLVSFNDHPKTRDPVESDDYPKVAQN